MAVPDSRRATLRGACERPHPSDRQSSVAVEDVAHANNNANTCESSLRFAVAMKASCCQTPSPSSQGEAQPAISLVTSTWTHTAHSFLQAPAGSGSWRIQMGR